MKLKPRTEQGANTGDYWQQNSRPVVKGLLYTALLLAFGAFTYLIGRNAAGHAEAAGPVHGRPAAVRRELTPLWSATTISQLDGVLAADQAGDLKTALMLATELKAKMPDTLGLDLYLSTLQVRQGKYDDAENKVVKLSDAFTPPLEAAAANEALGFNYARHRDLSRAISAFQDAAAADPFNPQHFLHWAEGLRRQGQLQEAVDHFRQALARLPADQPGVASQRAEVELKVNLSQIEAGKDDEVKSAIGDHLAERPMSGYWLLTAAAYTLQHGDMAGAAGNLQKARETLSPEIYAVLTSDYFFHNFVGHKEVAALLTADSPAARRTSPQTGMGFFLDP